MKRPWSVWVCLGLAFVSLAVLRLNASSLEVWIGKPEGAATLSNLRFLPYILFGLAAMWSARIANTPVYILSLLLIPAHYFFSGGWAPAWGGGDQLKFTLFLLVPVYVAAASVVSHRTLACTFACGIIVLALGFLTPPLITGLFGRRLSMWIGEHRWAGAEFFGAPSGPAIYYLSVLLLILLWPHAGREGQMKKILAAMMPCYYFSGVFRPVYSSGPMMPPAVEPAAFAAFSALAAAFAVYANGFLSWSKAYIDDLTQVLGRRALNESLAHLSGAYAIAMVDVDHFKKFNDTYGHEAGDVVLRRVAGILNDHSGGRVYRYGGEEFSVIFPNLDVAAAAEQVNAARQILAETKIPLNGALRAGGKSARKRDKSVTVHISAGVSQSTERIAAPEDVLRAADRALYRAKEKGRNRVELG